MKISEWPIYVNDLGKVFCGGDCDGEELNDEFIQAGRRTTFGIITRLLAEHVREVHKVDLENWNTPQ